jgi:hypothetical protein
MGFVLWYALAIAAPGPVPVPIATVSNDVFGGAYVLDADIDVPMLEGAGSAPFSVRIRDLPGAVVDTLKAVHQQAAGSADPMTVSVRLGYFDDPRRMGSDAVLEGAVTMVRTTVGADGAVVCELQGRDLAAWRLLRVANVAFSPGGHSTWSPYVGHVLAAAPGVSQRGAVIGLAPKDYALRAPTGLAALAEIARLAGIRFSVRDKAVHWQTAGVALPGPALDAGTNIVRLDDALSQAQPERTGREEQNAVLQTEADASFAVTVLGEPALRPGQTVPLVLGAGPSRTLHVREATHRFSTTSGYTCELMLGENGAGAQPPPSGGAQRIAHRIVDLVEARQGGHAAIDVGTVASYRAHQATVNVGQSPEPDTLAPSVASPVAEDVQLHDRPIASPFAWHRCGLVVPAYSGQRALLAHHRGSANDAIVHGYLWSEDPLMERPANEPGDWWLCLPTQTVADRPVGKAVNDLTDAGGLRVIQAKGLRIAVGSDALPAVGERPEVPAGLAETMVVEGGAGTKVTIARDGKVEISTAGKAISVANGKSSLLLDGERAELTNGTTSLKLDGPRATLTNGKVSVSLSGATVAIA